jgi:hypothetical protein
MSKDITSEIVDRKFAEAVDLQLPKHVQQMVAQELEAQVRLKIAPLVKEAAKNINNRISRLLLAAIVVIAIGFGIVIADRVLGTHAPWSKPVEATVSEQPVEKTPENPLQKFLGKLPKPRTVK